jgi:hypothetical protein
MPGWINQDFVFLAIYFFHPPQGQGQSVRSDPERLPSHAFDFSTNFFRRRTDYLVHWPNLLVNKQKVKTNG